MSLLRSSALSILIPSLALALAAPAGGQESAPPIAGALVRVAFHGAPGTWTPELPRLAARLELLLAAQGFETSGRELLAPGLVTLVGRARHPQALRLRALQGLLAEPQLAPWPGLRVLLSDADPAPQGWSLEGQLSFTLRRPEDATRTTLDLAREVARRHLEQRGTPPDALDEMLRHLELRVLREAALEGDPRRLDVRLAVRCVAARPEPLAISRWLALFAPRTEVELRPAMEAEAALRSSLRATPASASASEIAARAREASAGSVEARVRRATAAPFRRVEDLSFLSATEPLGERPVASLTAHRDALGGAALRWTLAAEARERARSLAPEGPWQLLVHGEVWGAVKPIDLCSGEGWIFGASASSDVELAARAFAPLDPPAIWTAR
jgi:hypothetical protein